MRRRDLRKYYRRQFLRFIRSPSLAVAYSDYRKAIKRADWFSTKQSSLHITEIARRVGDRRAVLEMVHALERVGCYQESAKLWLTEIAPYQRKYSNEWRGENLSNQKIIVDLNQTAGDGLGVAFRCSPLLRKVSSIAKDTVVIIEPRLIKTFQRSFPEIRFETSNDRIELDSSYFVLLPAALIALFAPKENLPDPEFHALIPNQEKVAEFKKKYLSAQSALKPVIGICWYSSHHGKDLPSLGQWRDFISRHQATFVSLQYGNVSSAVEIFGRNRIIVDPSVNQLVDMDTFIAQVASLDGVITIMNTLAHVGGALGVPTVVIRDDWFRRDLPVLADRLPWYPNLRVAGRNRREWPTVFDEALKKFLEMEKSNYLSPKM